MKIYFDVVTPAQVNFFKNIISKLKRREHDIRLSTRPTKTTLLLLNELGLQYFIVGTHHQRYWRKVVGILTNVKDSYNDMVSFNPDLVIGTIYTTYASKLMFIPSIKFEDDEVIRFQ